MIDSNNCPRLLVVLLPLSFSSCSFSVPKTVSKFPRMAHLDILKSLQRISFGQDKVMVQQHQFVSNRWHPPKRTHPGLRPLRDPSAQRLAYSFCLHLFSGSVMKVYNLQIMVVFVSIYVCIYTLLSIYIGTGGQFNPTKPVHHSIASYYSKRCPEASSTRSDVTIDMLTQRPGLPPYQSSLPCFP